MSSERRTISQDSGSINTFLIERKSVEPAVGLERRETLGCKPVRISSSATYCRHDTDLITYLVSVLILHRYR
jgi:hypothetical protein